MKYFIVADVHGFYDEMITALNKQGFDPNNKDHIFVSLGDAFDRGLKPDEVLKFMLGLHPDRRIFILGNHELLMESAIARRQFGYHDYSNGTVETVKVLTGEEASDIGLMMMKTNPLYNEYLHSCRCYYETKNGIFVHGWIPCFVHQKGFIGGYERHEYWDKWRDANFEEWDQATWLNGMACWADGVKESNKTIFCGHWHTAWGRARIDGTISDHSTRAEDYLPWVKDGIVALDACTVLSGIVNCYVFEDEPLKN